MLVALSGGADSVLLQHLVSASDARPRAFALHVDHGLRGSASREDGDFCAELCRDLGVPFRRVAVELDPDGPDLEARARRARYRALAAEARRRGVTTIVTGHHADDSLETLLMRWTRGSSPQGLAGPRPRLVLEPGSDLNPTAKTLVVARPLLELRRSEIRRALVDREIGWREDASNEDPRFTRSKIRHGLLPAIAENCGHEAVDHLLAFGRAVVELEDALAARTAHIAWERDPRAVAGRSPGALELGGRIERSELASLSGALRRRALARLCSEGTGRMPGARLLDLLLDDLARARCTRRTLPGGWVVVLRSSELLLLPPHGARTSPGASRQELLPFAREDAGATEDAAGGTSRLHPPEEIALEDGRRIAASVVECPAETPVPRGPAAVELDARDLPGVLTVRYPRSGDRFHALGAPGSRKLGRFLADAGIPREERGRVPLVFAGDELVWVAGVRPSEGRRIRPDTARRLRLELSPDGPRCDFRAASG